MITLFDEAKAIAPPDPPSPMMIEIFGTVKWFNGTKGYGFIEREDKEKDVFVHSSAVRDAGLKFLNEGDELTFEVESTEKGPSAVKLQKTS